MARALGFARIYLFTFDAESYYARMGWVVVERTEYVGAEVTVMRWDFGGVSDEEVLRRDEEMESGEVKAMSHEEFVRKVEEGRRNR